MGVPGLWDVLRPAGKSRSLTHLTVVDGFEKNPSGKRGYRVGIDASIWFFHANGGQGGENPELRTLYFRCCKLLSLPVLPLFVFDGPKRPSTKRGKRIGKNNHWLVNGMREIIDAFGFECWMAPGEAEAELAYLNVIGVIDAILSDDVDTFLFGAKVVIRNPSATLSGSQTHARKTGQTQEKNHVVIYRAFDIQEHEDVGLTRGDVVMIGLMAGGDYHQAGLPGCGMKTAHGLARCGYGDELMRAVDSFMHKPQLLASFLVEWRETLRDELRTNRKGYLTSRHPSLADKIPETFPDIDVLMGYARPVTSLTEGRKPDGIQWKKKPSLAAIASVCEHFFEWGVKEVIIKRFRTTVWDGAVLRSLMESALVSDRESTSTSNTFSTPRKSKQSPDTTDESLTPTTKMANIFSSLRVESPARPGDASRPSSALVVKIHSSRTHVSTDNMLEYRLEIDPTSLVAQAEAGVRGTRTLPELEEYSDGDLGENSDGESPRKSKAKQLKKPPPAPTSLLRVWMPAVMVEMAEPELVEEYEDRGAKKAAKGARKKASPKRKNGKAPPSDETDEEVTPQKPKATRAKSTPTKLFFAPNPRASPDKPKAKSFSEFEPPSLDNAADSDTDPWACFRSAPSKAPAAPDPFAMFRDAPPKAAAAKPKAPIRAESQKRPLTLAPSDSDDRGKLTRSPRKSKTHVSPRKVAPPAASSDEGPSRPVSPSPIRRRAKSSAPPIPADAEVIEISSDSEASPVPPRRTAPAPRPPPVTAKSNGTKVNDMKATVKAKAATKPPVIRPVAPHDSDDEIIDLT